MIPQFYRVANMGVCQAADEKNRCSFTAMDN